MRPRQRKLDGAGLFIDSLKFLRSKSSISLSGLLVVIISLGASYFILNWRGYLLPEPMAPLPYLVADDSIAYLEIASGHLHNVESPFTKRLAYPFLAMFLTKIFSVPLPESFLFLSLFSLGFLSYGVATFLEKVIGRPFWALFPLFTPFPYESAALGYLPDLFHMAFTVLFFLILLEGRIWASLILLFFLCLVRENTLLLCLILALIAWWRGKKELAWGAFAVLLLGAAIASCLAKLGKPNVHHLPDIIYLALKVPYNFMANILGIVVWTNVLHGGTPLFKFTLPPFVQRLGEDKQIGIFINLIFPFRTLIVLATIFGSSPLLLPKLFRSRALLSSMPFALQLMLVYGIISYFLGTSLGAWTSRLIGYGWPAFWLAIPCLLFQMRTPLKATGLWVPCFFIISWLPNLMAGISHVVLILPLIIVGLYGVTVASTGTAYFRGQFILPLHNKRNPGEDVS